MVVFALERRDGSEHVVLLLLRLRQELAGVDLRETALHLLVDQIDIP
jgi:hypothetical protein